MCDLFPDGCPTLWRHKNLFIDPAVFLKEQIAVHQVTVRAGQLLIIHPRVLHWGWNVGFTVSASVNYCIDVFLPFLCTTSDSYGGFEFDEFLSHHEKVLHRLGCDGESSVYGEITHNPEIKLEDQNYYFVHSRQGGDPSPLLLKAGRMAEQFINGSKWLEWWNGAVPSLQPIS